MRHLAYLRSSEDGADITRLEHRRSKDLPITMPPIDGGEYLYGWLDELGMCGQGMSGPVALQFSEVQSWAELTCTEIDSWEARTLIKLSKQYTYQTHISNNKACEAPFQNEVTEEYMQAVRADADKKLRSLF